MAAGCEGSADRDVEVAVLIECDTSQSRAIRGAGYGKRGVTIGRSLYDVLLSNPTDEIENVGTKNGCERAAQKSRNERKRDDALPPDCWRRSVNTLAQSA